VLEERVVDHVLSAAQVDNVSASYQDVVSGKAVAPSGDPEAPATA